MTDDCSSTRGRSSIRRQADGASATTPWDCSTGWPRSERRSPPSPPARTTGTHSLVELDRGSVDVWRRDVVRQRSASGAWYVATGLFLHPLSFDPIPQVITEAGLPVAGVMYDVIPYRFPDRHQVDEIARRLARIRAPLARTADLTLAISKFSAETAIEALGLDRDRVRVIGGGVDPRFVPPYHATEVRSRRGRHWSRPAQEHRRSARRLGTRAGRPPLAPPAGHRVRWAGGVARTVESTWPPSWDAPRLWSSPAPCPMRGWSSSCSRRCSWSSRRWRRASDSRCSRLRRAGRRSSARTCRRCPRCSTSQRRRSTRSIPTTSPAPSSAR